MNTDKTVNDLMTRPKAKAAKIPLEKLHPFEGHPYKVKDDEEMEALIDSFRENGILSPLIVRPLENASDEYEVISGHRRLHAAEKAGITEVPALIYGVPGMGRISRVKVPNPPGSGKGIAEHQGCPP